MVIRSSHTRSLGPPDGCSTSCASSPAMHRRRPSVRKWSNESTCGANRSLSRWRAAAGAGLEVTLRKGGGGATAAVDATVDNRADIESAVRMAASMDCGGVHEDQNPDNRPRRDRRRQPPTDSRIDASSQVKSSQFTHTSFYVRHSIRPLFNKYMYLYLYVYEGTYLPQNVVNLRKAPMIPGMLCSVIRRDNALDPLSGPRSPNDSDI